MAVRTPDDTDNPPMSYGDASMEMRPTTGSASGSSPFDVEQPPDVHEAMHNASKRALNTASMIALDPQDPRYQDKLANHVAHGELLKAEHENTMQVPSYGGPTVKGQEAPPPGQPIPTHELPQDEHKFRVDELKNRIKDAEFAGDHATAGQARVALATELRMNPLGSEGNQPGVLGKFKHVLGTIGNVVGNATLGPQNMALIPGSQANIAAGEEKGRAEEKEAATEKTGAERAEALGERASAAEETAKAAEKRADVAEKSIGVGKTGEENTLHDLMTGDNGNPRINPETNQPYTYLEAYGAVEAKKAKTAQEESLDKQYNDAVTAGNTTRAEQLKKEIADLAKAHQAPQRPPQILMIPPGGGPAQAVRPGTPVAPGSQTAAGFSTEGRPTTQMRNASAQAKTALEGIPGVIAEIDRLRDKIGPLSGRWNQFMQGEVGADDPEMAGLRSDLMFLSSAVALAHARGRLPENLRQEFERAINAPKQTPENLKAILGKTTEWMQRMAAMGEEGAGALTVSGGGTNGRPSFAEWQAQQKK